jgi:hypothetical protein
MLCERCGKPYTTGEHGLGVCPFEPRKVWGLRKQDTIVGGFVAENAWREPRYFDSQQRYEKALDESGLMLKEKKSRSSRGITKEELESAARRLGARGTSDGIAVKDSDGTFTVDAER